MNYEDVLNSLQTQFPGVAALTKQQIVWNDPKTVDTFLHSN